MIEEGYCYEKIKTESKQRNSENNKKYRFFYAHRLLEVFSGKKNIIFIDESNFTSIKK